MELERPECDSGRIRSVDRGGFGVSCRISGGPFVDCRGVARLIVRWFACLVAVDDVDDVLMLALWAQALLAAEIKSKITAMKPLAEYFNSIGPAAHSSKSSLCKIRFVCMLCAVVDTSSPPVTRCWSV